MMLEVQAAKAAADLRRVLRQTLSTQDRRALERFVFGLASVAVLALVGVAVVYFLIQARHIEREVGQKILIALGAVVAISSFLMLETVQLSVRMSTRARIERVEKRFEANPQAQNAWDLARVKLESYLDRNLSQVKSIYWLTVFVMGAGLALVSYGLMQSMQNPERLPVAIVASASGVLISFIGGSFLLIYRSIMTESRGYVSVLERINAVGMAVQVISSIPDADAELKNRTTAELAMQLLGLYAKNVVPRTDVEKSD